MGAPNSIQDEDITVPLPEAGNNAQTARALSVHVALSRLLAKVLNSECLHTTASSPSLTPKFHSCIRSRREIGAVIS